MDQHRAQTLQALEAFIHTQRQLLERQRSDIDKLHRLRVDLCARPAQVLANLSNELDDPAFRLSDQVDCRLKLPKDIHWSAFEKSDTTPLRTFAHIQAQKQTQLTALPSQIPANSSCGPNTTQHAHLQNNDHLSDLQKLVKTARRVIVDPVLDKFAGMSPEPRDLEEEEEEKKERKRRERAREEIMKLRGCGLRVRLSSAMVLEGEGMDVDVDVVDEDGGAGAAPMPMEVDEGATPAAAAPEAPVSVGPKRVRRKGKKSSPSRAKHLGLPAPPAATRVRRPPAPRKSLHGGDDDGGLMPPPSRIPRMRRKAAMSGETTPESTVEFGSASEHDPDQDQDQDHSDHSDDDDGDDGEESAVSQETRPKKSKFSKTRKSENAKAKLPKLPKAKPETYKQAWSVSEQNLLEQLLEEIQEGERNRWQKISRAMGGRRTPRQVASRVQKYFEKLKKFGVDA